MADYIEIEQLWECETCYHNGQYGCTLGLGCDHGESYRPDYSKLKKADVAPVVHGRWEYHECVSSHDGTISVYACSACSFCVDEEVFEQLDRTNYCPNCGAHMKDGDT